MANPTSSSRQAPDAEAKVVIRPAGALPPGGVRAGTVAGATPAKSPVTKSPTKGAPARKRAAKRPAKPLAAARLRARVRGMRFRLLPITIFVAVLMLGLRVGDLWRIASRDAALPDFPMSMAESTTATGVQAQTVAPAPSPASSPAPGGASPAAAPPPVTAADTPLGPIRNEELLQHFAERRAELERRLKEAEQREALLAAAEKRIDQKIQEMEKVRADIQKLMRVGDEKQTAQLDSLVKIYETMKPKDAARIFEELDMPVLLGVIERMKEQKTALVLAAMDPVKAKEVTSALVERRTLPVVAQ